MNGFERDRHRDEDFGRFFRSWIQNPLGIGAVAPSSRLLAKMMAADCGPGARVVELGGGTGIVTQAILDSGVRPEDLHVFERDEAFVALLRQRFPRSSVVHADAMSLTEHMRTFAGSIDCMISGLPLVLFSAAQKQRLLTQAFEVLRPEGALRQFTYGVRCPIDRDLRGKLGLTSALAGFAPFNLPPAFVYRLRRA